MGRHGSNNFQPKAQDLEIDSYNQVHAKGSCHGINQINGVYSFREGGECLAPTLSKLTDGFSIEPDVFYRSATLNLRMATYWGIIFDEK